MFNTVDKDGKLSTDLKTSRCRARFKLTLMRRLLQLAQPSRDFRCVRRGLEAVAPKRAMSLAGRRMVVFVPFNAVKSCSLLACNLIEFAQGAAKIMIQSGQVGWVEVDTMIDKPLFHTILVLVTLLVGARRKRGTNTDKFPVGTCPVGRRRKMIGGQQVLVYCGFCNNTRDQFGKSGCPDN